MIKPGCMAYFVQSNFAKLFQSVLPLQSKTRNHTRIPRSETETKYAPILVRAFGNAYIVTNQTDSNPIFWCLIT